MINYTMAVIKSQCGGRFGKTGVFHRKSPLVFFSPYVKIKKNR